MEHIVSRFDKDVKRIEKLLQKMAGLAVDQLEMATRALETHDTTLSQQVAEGDKEINALEARIDELAVRLIALRQPMAEDLRHVVSTLKISTNIERFADYAKTMAIRVPALASGKPVDSAIKTIRRMSNTVASMMTDALQSFIERDLVLAEATGKRDLNVDQMNSALFREMLTYMMENPRNIEASTHLLFIAKNLERAGDQVCNITEQVSFLVTGEIFENRGNGGPKTKGIGDESTAKHRH
ncbi:MAG: phosphate signaling complex protein PhoU [Rhodobacteraceae bacterium]|nr:phosphate signaling complex protein PhoU [Paracoccaceae bacterium]